MWQLIYSPVQLKYLISIYQVILVWWEKWNQNITVKDHEKMIHLKKTTETHNMPRKEMLSNHSFNGYHISIIYIYRVSYLIFLRNDHADNLISNSYHHDCIILIWIASSQILLHVSKIRCKKWREYNHGNISKVFSFINNILVLAHTTRYCYGIFLIITVYQLQEQAATYCCYYENIVSIKYLSIVFTCGPHCCNSFVPQASCVPHTYCFTSMFLLRKQKHAPSCFNIDWLVV